MARATWVLGATSVVGLVLSISLYRDNRALRDQLATQGSAPPATASPAPVPERATPMAAAKSLAAPPARTSVTAPPALPEPAPGETRMERRARRSEELAQMIGRLDGETDDEYRARVLPMLQAALLVPRLRVDEQRRVAEEKAHVSPEQSAKLDKAFDKVYGDVVDYANKAIADGQLSPYERNVSGWLEFAGGLGGILNEANGQIGKILDPAQVKAMSDAGFEWGEYLGTKAPWEQLRPPPPRGK